MTSAKPLPGRSLAELHPGLADQWHPTRNGDITPFMVTPASGKKVWWLGPCGHEWDAPPTSRTVSSTGCPVCKNKRVVQGFNDLATTSPELAREWHPTRNGELLPTMVTSKSSKRVWWLGPCGHEWDVKIVDRTQHSTGCPYCNGNTRIQIGINDLATIDPELASEWHPDRNGQLTPRDVRRSSVKKVWWLGPCGHEWQSTIAHRSSGRNCPYCAGKRVLVGFNDLKSTDPEIAMQWHPTKNGDVTPESVGRGSERRIWWTSHGHEWIATVSDRTSKKQGCAICSGSQVQRGVNDLSTTRPDLVRMWHPTKNQNLDPTSITSGSKKKVWWLGDCGHSWTASVVHLASGRGCAVCRGLQIEVGVNDLESQYPELAAQWHPTKNEGLTPRDVTSSSARKVWWICENGHEWRTGVNGRQYGAIGCPGCSDYGFSPSRDGWLYLLTHPIWQMLQIGISNVPERRLAQHSSLGWQVVEVRGPMDGALAQALEQEALAALRARGALLGRASRAGGFDGYTEAWPSDSLNVNSLRQILDWVYSDDMPISSAQHLEAWTLPDKSPKKSRKGLLNGTDLPAVCKIEGCERKHHGYGLCKLHYRRWIATGDTGPVSVVKTPNGTYKVTKCNVEGCAKRPVARGLCSMHYARWSKLGDPGDSESLVVEESSRICVVEGCLKPWTAREMCELHYRRFLSSGDPTVIRRGGKPKSKCSLDDCEQPAFGLGYCNKHYKRFRKYGDPHHGGRGS